MPYDMSFCVSVNDADMLFRTEGPDSNVASTAEYHRTDREPREYFWSKRDYNQTKRFFDCIQQRFESTTGRGWLRNLITEIAYIENIFNVQIGSLHCCVKLRVNSLWLKDPCFVWFKQLEST